MPTVGESNVPTPSVTLTLLMSHLAEVQSFIVSALLAKYVPNMFWNERSLVVRSSSFAASFAFQASQTLFSIAIIAAVLGSAAGFVGALSFVGFSLLPPAFAGGVLRIENRIFAVERRPPRVAGSSPNSRSTDRAWDLHRLPVRGGAASVKRSFIAKHVGVRIDLAHLRVFKLPVFDIALIAGDHPDNRRLVHLLAAFAHNELVAKHSLEELRITLDIGFISLLVECEEGVTSRRRRSRPAIVDVAI